MSNFKCIFESSEIVNNTLGESWLFDIHETPNGYVGIQNVKIYEYTVVDTEHTERALYSVAFEFETVKDLANWNNGMESVLYALYVDVRYEKCGFEIIEVFDVEEDAENYAKAKYPKMDIVECIRNHYN